MPDQFCRLWLTDNENELGSGVEVFLPADDSQTESKIHDLMDRGEWAVAVLFSPGECDCLVVRRDRSFIYRSESLSVDEFVGRPGVMIV